MGIFSDMNAKANAKRGAGGGNWFKPGKYLVRINRVFTKVAEDGSGKKRFIVEGENVETLNKLDGSNEEGAKVSFVRNLPGPYNYGLGDAMAFALAGYGFFAKIQDMDVPTESELTDEMMDDMIDEEDAPFTGIYLIADAYNKDTEGGSDFTLVDWSVPTNASELATA